MFKLSDSSEACRMYTMRLATEKIINWLNFSFVHDKRKTISLHKIPIEGKKGRLSDS